MATEITDSNLIGIGYVDVMRKWNELEPNLDIIDIDVAPIRVVDTRRSLSDRVQVRYRLEDLRFSLSNLHELSRETELIGHKINSHLAFMDVLGRRGPKDLGEYLMDTMGVALRYLPDAQVLEKREEVAQLFSELDTASSGLDYSPKGWERLLEKRLNKGEVLDLTNKVIDRSTRLMFSAIGRRFQIPYQNIYEETDRPTLFWIKGDRDGWKLSMNIHKRHDTKWIQGVEQRLGSHEGAHIVHGWSIRRNIDNKVLENPAYGITTVPGPEQWGMEGLADTMPLFVPEVYDQFDSFGRFMYQHQLLSRMVGNNIHKMVIDGDKSATYIKDYMQFYLPGETDESVESHIRSRTEGAVFPSYWGAYEDGCLTYMDWAEKLKSKPEQRARFLQANFERQWTKPQLEILFHVLSNGNSIAA